MCLLSLIELFRLSKARLLPEFVLARHGKISIPFALFGHVHVFGTAERANNNSLDSYRLLDVRVHNKTAALEHLSTTLSPTPRRHLLLALHDQTSDAIHWPRSSQAPLAEPPDKLKHGLCAKPGQTNFDFCLLCSNANPRLLLSVARPTTTFSSDAGPISLSLRCKNTIMTSRNTRATGAAMMKKRPNGTAAAVEPVVLDEETGQHQLPIVQITAAAAPSSCNSNNYSPAQRTVLSPSLHSKKHDLELVDDADLLDTSLHSSSSSSCEGGGGGASVSSVGSLKPSNPRLPDSHQAWQLLVGAAGIYCAYLYYGNVQEDLFRYRSPGVDRAGFTFVWFLQVMESAVTAAIGYAGRRRSGHHNNNQKWPVASFWKSGASQLAAKALMSMSLAAGLSFPVVVLAKSAKIVPVMFGQLIMGGSNYTARDYVFAALIVLGTSLLSFGSDDGSDDHDEQDAGHDTATGLVLILLSLGADGFTGGLQKKLKKETADLQPTAFDFLYFSHCAQLVAALTICVLTGELWSAPAFLQANPAVWWLVAASCVCSAVGQCFIFYVIACFDPLVCTTITTTRKVCT